MGSRKCFYLFNCDNTYNLDVVEELLNAIKGKTTDIDIQTKKEYFRLHQMSELAKTIDEQTNSGQKMDYAIFAINAHESRLSINEENAGIGYARIYRALLMATDERVIVIIGGDDNYRNSTEEDESLLSRWVRRKVSSQFREEFMDGTKGFIFSWDKKHREIHEEAILHFLDSKKKGEKFVYEQKPHTEPTKCKTAVQADDQKKEIEPHAEKIQQEESETPAKPTSANFQGEKDADATDIAESNDSGAKPKEKISSKSGTKLVVLGRYQSDLSLLENLFGDDFSGKVSFFSGPPEGLKDALRSYPRSCFIFVDCKASVEEFASYYGDLLNDARDKVAKKVVLIICDDNRQTDEDTITAKITEILKEKVWVLWWREKFRTQEKFLGCNVPFHRSQSLPNGSQERYADRHTPSEHIDKSRLVMKTRLRYGNISYPDVERRSGQWSPSKEIVDGLLKDWHSAPNVELLIHEHRKTGKTHYRVVVNDNSQNKYIVQFFYSS
ncbi:uncharacterized protein LOC111341863 [Stylophora pistillata]|uniref:uncharacterized protein LOC111341863 n=1 Tax=Stylophora pistillata TaxID=50429 RepID=UPI000C0392F0|nr:uncharacterized protein LOC111341863 [Stylophora pistillata]